MLNKTKGNMYEFITHTWNCIKGRCYHDCAYCFMKKLTGGSLKDIHFDEKELRTDLGTGNFIFVGSSNDPWAKEVPDEWIAAMLDHCAKFDNRYLFQSKNPGRFMQFIGHPAFQKAVFCTTIESNRRYDTMGNAPDVKERASAMGVMANRGFTTFVTAEPIHDFDLAEMYGLIMTAKPVQVNIGRNTNWNVNIVEPSAAKVLALGNALFNSSVRVEYKRNIRRYLGVS